MSKVTNLRKRIRKKQEKKKKQLKAFVVFLLFYLIVVFIITWFVGVFYDVTKHRTVENTHTVAGILEDTWSIHITKSPEMRYFIIDGKKYSCAATNSNNGWNNLEKGSNITVVIDNGDENKSKIPVHGVECNGVVNFGIEDENRESKILRTIFTPIFIIVYLVAFIILAFRIIVFAVTWHSHSEKKLKKKLKEAQNSD